MTNEKNKEPVESPEIIVPEEITKTNDLEAMKITIEEQRVLMEDYLDRWKRLQAEFDNFRKREEKQNKNLKTLVVEDTVSEFLSVADNLERAMNASAQENTSIESLVEGIRMVHQHLDSVLKKMNVERLNVLGAVFDPNKHEAVSKGVSQEFEKDHVMEVFQNAWTLNQKIIRHAMVMVSEGAVPEKDLENRVSKELAESK
jgi:molecular chaperone GrpE